MTHEIRQDVFNHIRENGKKKNIHVDFINGYTDHVHCLVSMNDEHSIKSIAHLLKGESSHWINQNKLTKERFSWQDEYFAIGVGKNDLTRVRKYIATQESHHSGTSFQQESDKIIERYGFDIVKNGLG